MERTIEFSASFSGKMRDVLRRRFSARFCTFLKKERGRILLNGRVADGRTEVSVGDRVTARFSEEKSGKVSPCALPLSIAYEDEDIVVIDKACGVASVSTFGYENNNLLGALFARSDDRSYHILTRLDKDTQGLCLFAKSGVVASMLSIGEIEKTYLAEAEGRIGKRVTVDVTQGRGADVTRVVEKGGLRAVTSFTPVAHTEKSTLCTVSIESGRTHQIRLAAAHIGHPLVGDTLYGNGIGAYNSGQHLCCYKLRFLHPVTAAMVEITAKNPSFCGQSIPLLP